MKKAFVDVNKLNKLEAVGLSRKICKFAEESGEIMQVICRYVGMKANKMSPEEMREEALGEVADIVQNSFCIASEFNITLKEITYGISIKRMYANGKHFAKEKTLEDLGCNFYIKSGKLTESAHSNVTDLNAYNVKLKIQEVLVSIFAIAAKLGIKLEEIEPKILEKDKKWLKRINSNLF